MGRPRIHPRKLYRAIDSGVYFDQESGYELVYSRFKPTILPDKSFDIPLGVQEKMARKLAAWGLFEPLDDMPDEIERVTDSPTSVQ